MKQGRVFIPRNIFPPGQKTIHYVVILSNDFILKRMAASQQGGFVVVGIIRSAVNQSGNRVKLVPGHSFPLGSAELSSLSHESIIETHQLFSLHSSEFHSSRSKHIGDLPKEILHSVLEGAQRLLGPVCNPSM